MEIDFKEIKCKNCGAAIRVYQDVGKATCNYCGCNYLVHVNKEQMTATYNDSPIQVDLLYVEDDYELELKFGYDEPLRAGCDYYLHFGGQVTENQIQEIINEVKLLSGYAYALKRSYKTKEEYNLYTYHTDCVSREKKIVDKGDQYHCKKVLDHSVVQGIVDEWNSRSAKVENYAHSLIERLKKIGLDLSVETNPITRTRSISELIDSDGKYKSYRYGGNFPWTDFDFNEHRIKLNKMIITPEFFSQYFKDSMVRYDQIREKDVINTIIEKISVKINNDRNQTHNNVNYELLVDSDKISFGDICWCKAQNVNSLYFYEHFGKNNINIMFHQLSMENIEDDDTKLAVGLSIVEKLFSKYNKQDGKNVLGISPAFYHNSIYSYSSDGETEYYYKPIMLFRFRLLENTQKKYNSW